ncbi:hypothetical protein DBR32_13845 [Taibaiella sp. KBW10]|uniref:PorP/SprF family type IX secretion system membrane protein n=1 Tax=Taibaiella sp. KBW10 TaxID=2153357 RepID=UPI000F5AEAC5|nr:PorP/SprF family type IX secretion system membrane protein [Taibaiella sp. KBW10]RQO29990.1 hypothetical protein DBR32_13845 [Taibaiella sp. KBW10]
MKCRNTIAGALLFATSILSVGNANAQDVHFTQFNASPLTINPAFTGAFQGEYRVSAVYRDQWRSALGTAAFKTYAVSVDMPLIRDISVDDYLAGGLQLYNDRAGDGNLNNFSGLASIAYHKFLGNEGKMALTVGLQGGYSSKNLDLSKLYFAGDFNEGGWNQGIDPTWGNLNNRVGSWVVNAGLAWSHAASDKFSYTLGVGANNLTQPLESFQKQRATKDVGLGIRYTAQAGAVIGVSERFSIRPAFLYQSQAAATELVGGAEVHYKLGDEYMFPGAPAIYAGGWYRYQDAAMMTLGVEFKGFRIGAGYDFNTSALKSSTGGNGGFEVMLRYIAASPIESARKLLYPCGRF